MDNTLSKAFFANMAKNQPDQKSVKINSFNDYTQYDVDFILKYANQNTSVLDVASGTGLIINKLYDKVKDITAVELFTDFSKFIVEAPNVIVVNQDVAKFDTKKTFDLVTMFGIMQYFNEEESREIYKKYFNFVKKGGTIIVKGQLGVKEDVTVSGFSEELKTNYYSQYRYKEKEIEMIESAGFNNSQLFDIYPKECNRWENTHFYAIVANKP